MTATLTAAQAPTATQAIRQGDANPPVAQTVIIHVRPEPAAGFADEAGSEPESLSRSERSEIQERPAMPDTQHRCRMPTERQGLCGMITGLLGMAFGGLVGAVMGGFTAGMATASVFGVGCGLAGARSQGPLC